MNDRIDSVIEAISSINKNTLLRDEWMVHALKSRNKVYSLIPSLTVYLVMKNSGRCCPVIQSLNVIFLSIIFSPPRVLLMLFVLFSTHVL